MPILYNYCLSLQLLHLPILVSLVRTYLCSPIWPNINLCMVFCQITINIHFPSSLLDQIACKYHRRSRDLSPSLFWCSSTLLSSGCPYPRSSSLSLSRPPPPCPLLIFMDHSSLGQIYSKNPPILYSILELYSQNSY